MTKFEIKLVWFFFKKEIIVFLKDLFNYFKKIETEGFLSLEEDLEKKDKIFQLVFNDICVVKGSKFSINKLSFKDKYKYICCYYFFDYAIKEYPKTKKFMLELIPDKYIQLFEETLWKKN